MIARAILKLFFIGILAGVVFASSDNDNYATHGTCQRQIRKMCRCGMKRVFFPVTIDMCTYENLMNGTRNICLPCNGLSTSEDDDPCDVFKYCENCFSGVNACTACPVGRYGDFCENMDVRATHEMQKPELFRYLTPGHCDSSELKTEGKICFRAPQNKLACLVPCKNGVVSSITTAVLLCDNNDDGQWHPVTNTGCESDILPGKSKERSKRQGFGYDPILPWNTKPRPRLPMTHQPGDPKPSPSGIIAHLVKIFSGGLSELMSNSGRLDEYDHRGDLEDHEKDDLTQDEEDSMYDDDLGEADAEDLGDTDADDFGETNADATKDMPPFQLFLFNLEKLMKEERDPGVDNGLYCSKLMK